MVIVFKILFFLFTLGAIVGVLRRGREGVLSNRGVWFWAGFWLVALGAVLYPGSTQVVAHYLGIGRGADLVFYATIVALFYLVFHLHIKLEILNRNITKIVRDQALSSVQRADKKNTKS